MLPLLAVLGIPSAFAGITGAVHKGTIDGAGIQWESTFTGHDTVKLQDGRTLSVKGRTEVRTHQEDWNGLHPPIVPDTWQRIDLDGLTFTPAEALGLQRRVDGWCPPAFGLSERAQLEAIDPHVGFSTYVDGSTTTLPGEVEEAGKVTLGASLGAAAIFVCAVLVMILGRRVVARWVQREDTEAYIHKEFVDRR